MSNSREKVIHECVEAMQRINKEHGFSTISKHTLNIIVASFIAKNNSPDYPNANKPVVQGDEVKTPVVPVIKTPAIKSINSNVIGLFDNKSDFKSIEQANKENNERIRLERLKNNRKILGPKSRRK